MEALELYYIINKDGLYLSWIDERGYLASKDKIIADKMKLSTAKEILKVFPHSGLAYVKA
jgi:hypothetical protein